MQSENIGIPKLSLKQLKAAAYVAEYRNLTKAANELNRAQTTITKSISELEDTLNVTLFDRSTSGMMPTAHAQALSYRVTMAQKEFEKAGMALENYVQGGRSYKTIPIFSMEISYKRLAAFVALYELRNIAGASTLLGVTKAAIYNSVRELNQLLGTELFEREPNGVSPTAYCHVLAQHVKLAFSEIRHLINDLHSLEGVTKGSVVVGTLPYSKTFITPRAINRLLASHPELTIATRGGSYFELEAALRSGDVDLIIGAVRPAEEGAEIKPEILFEDKLSVIARAGHPLANKDQINIQDLADADWILPGKHTPSRKIFDDVLHEAGMKSPEQAIETGSLSMVRGLLRESDRVALLSEHQIFYDIEAGDLITLPVNLEETYRPLGVTMRAHTQPSPAAQLFLDELRSVVAELRETKAVV